MTTALFEAGHVVAGRYRIEQLLGQGGMGSVYRAVQLSVGRKVALKLLMDEHVGSAELLGRFQREAMALARLAHPNTVRLFDFGIDAGGCPFLVMELLRGADLARDIERQGPLRYDHALEVARQIASSLSEAHDAGIVHRDIKPANVFLSVGSSWPLVKVLDFGIVGASAVDPAAPRLTQTGTVLGSVPYMSPEQAQGHAVGPAADLYALGVVLFEMLTARTLFEPRVLTAQLLAKVMEPAPRLRDVAPALDVPVELEALVAELVQRDAARRPASARVVLERIDALLARAQLPPLSRSLADTSFAPASSPTLRGVAQVVSAVNAAGGAGGVPKTEPMLVAHTMDDGWAPRPSDSFPPPLIHPRAMRSHWRAGRSGVALALTVLGTGAVGSLAGPFRSTPAGQAFASAVAPLAQLVQLTQLTQVLSPAERARAEEAPAAAASMAAASMAGAAMAGAAMPDGASAIAPSASSSPAAIDPDVSARAVEESAANPERPEAPAAEAPAAVASAAAASAPVAPAVVAPTAVAPAAAKPPRLRTAAPSPPQRSVGVPVASSPVATAQPEAPRRAPLGTWMIESPPEPSTLERAPSASATPAGRAPDVTPEPAAVISPGPILLPETAGAGAGVPSAQNVPSIPESTPWPEASPEREGPAAPPVTLTPSPGPGQPGSENMSRERRRSIQASSLSSIAAIEAAFRAGQISWSERKELVATVRQLQADAHARAVRDYREGRISRRALWLRQRNIDRELEGEPAYRPRIRLSW